MNDDENHPHPQPWIDPALEARVVASVLGETSAFENEELERAVAESPELAVFKRRIEAVHGLVGTAVGPEIPRIQLSPERREKLLATLGAQPAEPPTKMAAWAFPRPAGWSSSLLIRIAAGFVMGAIIVTFLLSVARLRSPNEPSGLFAFKSAAVEFADADQEREVDSIQPDLAKKDAGDRPVTSEVISMPLARARGSTAAVAEATAGERAASSATSAYAGETIRFDSSEAQVQPAEPATRTFTGGWGKGSGAGTGIARNEVAGDEQSVAAKPAESWDSVYLYRGVNVLTNEKSAKHQDARDPQAGALTSNVINQPVFSTPDGKVEFDGFVHYGMPISPIAPAEATEGGSIKKFLEEAESFSNSGRFDLAFKRYEQVLNVDPAHGEARRGMEKVNAAKAQYYQSAFNETRSNLRESVDKEWERPARRYDLGASSIVEQPDSNARGTAEINRKLDEILIPRIDFKDATVREAVEFLGQRAQALDTKEAGTGKKGVEVVLNLPKDAPESETRVTLSLTDIPLRGAIDYVAAVAGMKVKVEPSAVALLPLSEVNESLLTKEYPVPPGFIPALPESGTNSGAKDFLEAAGVTFPPGASATHLASSHKLVIRNTAANLELVDALVETKLSALSAPENRPESAEVQTAGQPVSTFSLHVGDVSFQLARDALANGAVPDPNRIRTEEFYNAFDYNDPAPAPGEEVACRVEQSAHPFRQQRDLVRIALKVAAAGRVAGQPLRLTILLDTSGSMEREDRADSVRRALQTLAALLGPDDRVTLVGFARTPRLLAEQVPGDQAGQLAEIAGRTPSEGGTNLEAALALAAELALKHKLPAAQNRIVLLTDGAANLGDADPERLARQIEKTRQQGISFDACGVGANGLNDEILEALTRKGDGRYYFLNHPEDADAGFARQLAGALRPAAENVKVQVVFNPARVRQYRLIGFEKHLLKAEDFRNDQVQAAKLSAEEAGNALYQVETLPEGEGELGQVFVRFRDPATGSMVERSWPLPYEARPPAFDQASPSMQLAATAALLAEKLRGDAAVDLDALAPVINALRGHYPHQARVDELLQMVERLRVTKP